MAVGVVWGTEFVVVAAVFVTGVVAGAVCDLMLACGRGATGAVSYTHLTLPTKA